MLTLLQSRQTFSASLTTKYFIFQVHCLYENELFFEKNDRFVAAQRKETRNQMLREWDLNSRVIDMDTILNLVLSHKVFVLAEC